MILPGNSRRRNVGRLRLALKSLAGLSMMFLMGGIQAAEWSAQGSGDARLEYNDNFRLTALPHPAVWITGIQPSLALGGKAERWNVSAAAALAVNQYAGESDYDAVEPRLAVSSGYNGERYRGMLDAQYRRDSTLANELTDTGVVLARSERRNVALNPSLQYAISGKTALDLSYGLSESRYQRSATNGLFNYRNRSASAGITYQFSAGSQFSFSASYSRYETIPREITADNYGLRAGIARRFSETMNGSLSLGANKTLTRVNQDVVYCPGPLWYCYFGLMDFQTTTVTIDNKSNNYSVGAVLMKELTESSALNARLDRNVNPSGSGSFVQTDSVGLSFSHQWNPRLTGFVDGTAYRTKFFGSAQAGNNGRYYVLAPRLHWEIAEDLSLEAGIRRTSTVYDSGDGAVSNAVYAALSYSGTKAAVGR